MLEDLNRTLIPHSRYVEDYSEYDDEYEDNWVDEINRQIQKSRNPSRVSQYALTTQDRYYIDRFGERHYYPNQPVKEATYGTAYTGATALRGTNDVVNDVLEGTGRTTSDVLKLRPLRAVADAVEYTGRAAVDTVRLALSVPAAAVVATASTAASVGGAVIDPEPEWWHEECTICTTCNSCNRIHGPHDPECKRKCDFCAECVQRRTASGKHTVAVEHYEKHMFDEIPGANEDIPFSNPAQGKETPIEPTLSLCTRARDCIGCGTCMNLAGGKGEFGNESKLNCEKSTNKKACGCFSCVNAREYKAKVQEVEEVQKRLAGAKMDDLPVQKNESVMPSSTGQNIIPKAKGHAMGGGYNHHAGCDCPSCKGVHRTECTCPKCIMCGCGCREKQSYGNYGRRGKGNCGGAPGCTCDGYPPAGKSYAKGCHSRSSRMSKSSGRETIFDYDPPLSGGKTFCCETVPKQESDSCVCGRTTLKQIE